MSTIGERIHNRRTELGLSQHELAVMVGYKSDNIIEKLETGRSNLDRKKLDLFAEALQTTSDYILGTDSNQHLIQVGARIKELRTQQNLPQSKFAELLGYNSKASISRIENGMTDLPLSKINEMAEVLHCTPEYLMFGDIVNMYTDERNNVFDIKEHRIHRTIPYLGEIACGKPIFINREYDSFVEIDANVKADFCLSAHGDSMINARIYDGDLIFVKECSTVDNGDIAVVVIGDEVTLKRFYFFKESNTVQLVAENPSYAPMIFQGSQLEQIHVLGKAISLSGNLK